MINQVAIVTDTTACIPKELVKQYGIEVVPIEFTFDNMVYRDGIDMSPANFYALLRQAEKLPTSAAPSPSAFLKAYDKANHRAASILCITLPTKFSGVFNSAQLAVEMARTALPNVTIEVFDCGTAAAAEGLVVLAAARAAVSGRGLTEVSETARRITQRVNLFATLDSLNYLVRGGRVPKAAALASSLLQIKPIFTVTDGEAHPVTNTRTTTGAMKRLLKIMRQKAVKGQPLHVAVMHADALGEAMILKNRISAQFDCTELFITEFTPVMGVHTGPGVLGIAFYSGD